MLLFALILAVTTQASDPHCKDLASNVRETLNECLTIFDKVRNHVQQVHALDDLRRRATDKKLESCVAILAAVDSYRVKHSRQLLIQNFAEWPGNEILDVLLKPVNKRVGEVLYIASRDGDAASRFHSFCDNKGATIVVVQSSTGAVFGAYTEVSWTHGCNCWKKSYSAFLFRIRPSYERYDIKSGQNYVSLLHATSKGPWFDGSLRIGSKALHTSNSIVGGSYFNVPSNKPYILNDGQYQFKVRDYVVMKAI